MRESISYVVLLDICILVSLNACSDAAQSGIIVWDCKYNEEVMLIPYMLFLAGDNPMQAEECSHAGLNCNYFCRTCKVGGTKEYKESKAGYNTPFLRYEHLSSIFHVTY
jgi:hypothetical protein